jgi:pentose-5-phosphate-3-epimerase
MIVDPDRYIKTFADLGANILSVHYEACTHQDVTGYKSRRNERE